jgi:hypothetical protein
MVAQRRNVDAELSASFQQAPAVGDFEGLLIDRQVNHERLALLS